MPIEIFNIKFESTMLSNSQIAEHLHEGKKKTVIAIYVCVGECFDV